MKPPVGDSRHRNIKILYIFEADLPNIWFEFTINQKQFR